MDFMSFTRIYYKIHSKFDVESFVFISLHSPLSLFSANICDPSDLISALCSDAVL